MASPVQQVFQPLAESLEFFLRVLKQVFQLLFLADASAAGFLSDRVSFSLRRFSSASFFFCALVLRSGLVRIFIDERSILPKIFSSPSFGCIGASTEVVFSSSGSTLAFSSTCLASASSTFFSSFFGYFFCWLFIGSFFSASALAFFSF